MSSISNLRLCDIAIRQVSTVEPQTPIVDALETFVAEKISSLVVLKAGKPVGIVTERDLVRVAVERRSLYDPISSIMSSPLLTARMDLDYSMAQVTMHGRGVRHLVLVDAMGLLAGLVTESDFRRNLGSDLDALSHSLELALEAGGELLSPDLPLHKALSSMLIRRQGFLVAGHEGEVQGILTERDIPRLLLAPSALADLSLGDVMVREVKALVSTASLADAACQMEQHAIRHLVVLDTFGHYMGVVSQHRLLGQVGLAMIESSRERLEERVALVLEHTGVGTWEYDHLQGRMIRSSSLNTLLHLSGDDFIESLESIALRVVPEDRQRFLDAFQNTLSSGSAHFSLDYQVKGGDGRLRWLSSRGRVVDRDEHGHPRLSSGVAIDISQQKEAALRLQESEVRLRGFIEQMPLPLRQSDTQQNISFINRHFTDTFGYTIEDLPNLERWWELAYPDEAYRNQVRGYWQKAVDQAKQAGRPVTPGEYRICCKDGSYKIAEISGIVLGKDVLSTFVDVTARREEQSLLEFSNAVLKDISRGSPLADVLDVVARFIESLEPDICCSLLLLDPDNQRLRHLSAPSLPGQYCEMVDGLSIGPDIGICGQAAYFAKDVFIEDLELAPTWQKFLPLSRRYHLRAAWSSPVLSASGAVLGTLCVYWKNVRHVLPETLRRHVSSATALAAVAIEGARREADLLAFNETLSRAETLGRVGSWSWNLQTKATIWSPQLFRLLDFDPLAGMPEHAAFMQKVHPEDRPLLERAYAQMEEGVLPESFSYRLQLRDGSLRYLYPSFSVIRDDHERVVRFEGTVQDVSDAKLAEIRLLAQLEELRRWQQATLGREGRVLELKREVNALLNRIGEPPRYSSVLSSPEGGF